MHERQKLSTDRSKLHMTKCLVTVSSNVPCWTCLNFLYVLQSCQQLFQWFSKSLTETLLRYYLPVVINFYQAAWKNHQSFGSNFKPWSSGSFIISSHFKCTCDVNNFAAILMQINFNHIVNNKLASSSASCLRSGD